jgi:hypothetical protein
MTPSDPTAALKNSGDMLLGELKRQRLVLISLGVVLIGVLAAVIYTAYVASSLQKTPTGSPIVVRGGSVEIDSTLGWEQSSVSSQYNTLVAMSPPLNLYLENATPADGLPNGAYPLPLNNNWKVTLTFADSPKDPQQHSISLCSNSSCNLGNDSPFPIPQVVAMGDPDGKWSTKFYKNNSNGTIAYTVQHCHGQSVSDESPCNHISHIKIEAGSLRNPGSSLDYSCPDATPNTSVHCKLRFGP